MTDDGELPLPPGAWPGGAAAGGGPGHGSYAPSQGPNGNFDQMTRKVGGLRSRRSVLRLGLGALIAAVAAWFIWGRRQGSECSTKSTCGDRHYCNDEETCICTETSEGNLRCGQVPPYCNVPLCTTSADCSHLGDGWFCDAPNSGCCSDPPAELSRCIAPCGAEYPPAPTTTTTTTTAPPAEPAEVEEDEGDDEPANLRLAATPEDGLLFFTRREDGSGEYYYGEVAGRGGLAPTHVVFEDSDGSVSIVVFDEDLRPISWTAPHLSIAARAESSKTGLDPHDALHAVIVDAEETVQRIDLVPVDLDLILERGEAMTGRSYPAAHEALEEAPSDWDDLVEAARTPGRRQPQRLANALGLSITHAAAALLEATDELDAIDVDGTGSVGSDPEPVGGSGGEEDDDGDDTEEPSAQTTRPAGLLSPGVQRAGTARAAIPLPYGKFLGPLLESMVKNALLNMGAGSLFAPETPTDPNEPSVDLLLCQGATSWGVVCHYAFFRSDDILGCIDFCKTDLGCFTNICMPVTFTVEDASGLR